MENEKQVDLFAEHREHEQVQEKKKQSMILLIINKALDVLSIRMQMFFALVFSFTLFLWVMFEPNIMRLIGAAAFPCLTFLPILFKLSRQRSE